MQETYVSGTERYTDDDCDRDRKAERWRLSCVAYIRYTDNYTVNHSDIEENCCCALAILLGRSASKANYHENVERPCDDVSAIGYCSRGYESQ